MNMLGFCMLRLCKGSQCKDKQIDLQVVVYNAS